MKKQIGVLQPKVLEHVMRHFKDCLGNVTAEEFQPTFICLVGSVLNGVKSDIDIAIQYRGNMREDDVFNSLIMKPLFIEGSVVDFIPLSEQKGNFIDCSKKHIILLDIKQEERNYPEFDVQSMKRLVEKDKLLAFVYRDLLTRNHDEHNVLEIIFNGYVLDDSSMVEEYQKV